jgi:hypothetical protein
VSRVPRENRCADKLGCLCHNHIGAQDSRRGVVGVSPGLLGDVVCPARKEKEDANI